MRTRSVVVGPDPLDTNTCSWSDEPHDEHVFEAREGHTREGRPVAVTTALAPSAPARRPRRHTTHRRAETHRRQEPGSFVFRPGGPVERRKISGSASHRARPTHSRCDDPRVAARAAALRRRHLLLVVTAVVLLVALAGLFGGRGDNGLAGSGPARTTNPAPAVGTGASGAGERLTPP